MGMLRSAQALADPTNRLIIHSNAGHPPTALVHAEGTCELLDQASDPPLGARPQHVPRPQATVVYGPGDTLVLCTDGLIERRGEDIDTGLAELTGLLVQYRHVAPEDLADILLVRLGLAGGGRDDAALIIVRL
ncbi:serine phosphatase RsbU (regulator of sigma subunit) [Streptomyces sp. 3330]|nr:serine phosphatase RsbU (regulator of sigma subunit) [Streptomyces sp. 3330]